MFDLEQTQILHATMFACFVIYNTGKYMVTKLGDDDFAIINSVMQVHTFSKGSGIAIFIVWFGPFF